MGHYASELGIGEPRPKVLVDLGQLGAIVAVTHGETCPSCIVVNRMAKELYRDAKAHEIDGTKED